MIKKFLSLLVAAPFALTATVLIVIGGVIEAAGVVVDWLTDHFKDLACDILDMGE